LISTFLTLFALVAHVVAQITTTDCYTTGVIPPTGLTELSNLNTPTAFTYNAIFSVVTCSEVTLASVPTAYTSQFYTAWANGVSYPGLNPMVYSTAIDTPGLDFYTAITFPGLTVTVLTPGEAITLSWEAQAPNFFVTGYYEVFVPADATPAVTSTSSSSTGGSTTGGSTTGGSTGGSTAPPAGPTNTSSSSLAGPIAGGVVGGIVVLGVVAGLLFVFLRRRNPRPTGREPAEYQDGQRAPLPGYDDKDDAPVTTTGARGLRYVDEDQAGETSGRVGGDY